MVIGRWQLVIEELWWENLQNAALTGSGFGEMDSWR
jgi:hypothetical protein